MSGLPGLPGTSTGGELLEPPGYSVVSFIGSAAFVFGVGTAPWGLIIVVIACWAASEAWKRLQEANPKLVPQDDAEYMQPVGRPFLRLTAMSVLPFGVLSIAAFFGVREFDTWVAAIWPALVAGFMALGFNWLLRRAVAAAHAERERGGLRPGGRPPPS